MLDPLRHHKHRSENTFGDSAAERLAEKVSTGMGTVMFIVVSTLIIIAWVFANGAVSFIQHTVSNIEHGRAFDAEPWILLNLIFSSVAFYTGALVIIAAKAEAKKANAREEADAKHREDLHEQIVTLLGANTDLTQQVHALSVQVHDSVCKT